jgi:hypothetical protein
MFKRFNILLTQKQFDALMTEARRLGISITEVIRRILDHSLGFDKIDK